mmetsp:Transcript_57931/g.137899  ORF Transcript_57931/g.137899 Transcript_57931/m.137899 type:complete len:610 (+) Transcript_57931:137-1966(+)
MGAIACARCDASQCRTCTNCQQHESYDRYRGSSQHEEEVQMHDETAISLDYGFLAKYGRTSPDLKSVGHTNGHEPSRSSAEPRKVMMAKALYEPGALVPIRFAASGRAKALLEETYRLHKEPLGRGSYGEVLLAEHLRTGARRAVKSVSKAALRRYVHDVDRFVRREVDILRRLDHPNIIRPYEAFEDEDSVHLVLEVCNGGDLLERVTVSRQRMPEKEAALLLQQMLSAVQHLHHSGVVHRDIKPENFLFTQREPEREPLPPAASPLKLIDFGLSRRLGTEAGVSITQKIGTTEYMAPESFAGRMSMVLADRADMWSIGVVLHIMFIGHFPSPKLAEQATEDYLAAPCWRHISKAGLDLLGHLLRFDPSSRHGCSLALRHPWLVEHCNSDPVKLLPALPSAVRSFAEGTGLRRIFLAACAREVDDTELQGLRRLYQALCSQCVGALTISTLERMLGPAGGLAAQMATKFELIDMDGSGIISWTEFVAISLASNGNDLVQATIKAGGAAAVSTPGRSMPAQTKDLPQLQDDHCWRAFELVSGGSEQLTGESLCKFGFPSISHKKDACPFTGDLQEELRALDETGGLSLEDVRILLGLAPPEGVAPGSPM